MAKTGIINYFLFIVFVILMVACRAGSPSRMAVTVVVAALRGVAAAP